MPSYSKVLLALVLVTAVAARPAPQLAGEGNLFDSLFTDTDNGVGYGIENAEDNLAADISGAKTGTAGSGSGSGAGANPPPPPPPKARRQLDKISNGLQTLSGAAGMGASTEQLTGELDTLDGTLTDGASNAGEQLGSTEEGALEGLGNSVPKY